MSIVYFTKGFQPMPALYQLYQRLGGHFVTTRRSTSRAIERAYSDVKAESLRGILSPFAKGKNLLEQADLVVTGNPYKKLLGPYKAKKYNVFHGTYTYLGRRDLLVMSHFDCLCVIGPRMREAIALSGLEVKFEIAGYLPFMEYPERCDNVRNQVLSGMGLNPDQPTVLYVPTGKPWGSWDWLSFRLVEEAPSNFNLILRPHPSHSVTSRLHDTWQFNKLKSIARKRGRTVIDLAGNRLSSLYAAVDLVISDGTSTAEESLYYDLPQIIVESPFFSRKHVEQRMCAQEMPQHYIDHLVELYDCGTILTPHSKHLAAILETAISDASRYAVCRNRYFKWVFGERSLAPQHQFIESLRSFC
jgi:hypothetical protein